MVQYLGRLWIQNACGLAMFLSWSTKWVANSDSFGKLEYSFYCSEIHAMQGDSLKYAGGTWDYLGKTGKNSGLGLCKNELPISCTTTTELTGSTSSTGLLHRLELQPLVDRCWDIQLKSCNEYHFRGGDFNCNTCEEQAPCITETCDPIPDSPYGEPHQWRHFW